MNVYAQQNGAETATAPPSEPAGTLSAMTEIGRGGPGTEARRARPAPMDAGTAMGAGWSSGISVYGVVALVGVAGRLDWIQAPSFVVQAWVIGVAVLLFLVEFVVDKIALVDTAWDGIAGAVPNELWPATVGRPTFRLLRCEWSGERAASELARRLKVVKVNVDEAPSIASRFAVQGIPTLLILRDGHPIARQVGALPPDRLVEWARRAIQEPGSPAPSST
jgi:hypothetical protein